jgi:hypothetical protein
MAVYRGILLIPATWGSAKRKSAIQAHLVIKGYPYLKNDQCKKDWWTGLGSKSTCIARPRVQPSVLPNPHPNNNNKPFSLRKTIYLGRKKPGVSHA